MIELVNLGKKFNFMGHLKLISSISLIVVLVSLYGIFNKINYGVDFRGGAQVQASFAKELDLDKIRDSLDNAGLDGISVQTIGEEKDHSVLINVQATEEELNPITEKVTQTLQKEFTDNTVTIQKVDIVGPKAGNELRTSAILAMFWALVSIMVYIGIRFDFRYAPGTMVSVLHDLLVIGGFIALTGMEFSLQIVGALLALIGYSVNDTVVVYDRIREYEVKSPGKPLIEVVNDAVNDTLSRTVVTALSTLILCVFMFIFAGGTLRDFFMILSVGILLGTYSTVYIAAGFVILADYLSRKFGKKSNHATV